MSDMSSILLMGPMNTQAFWIWLTLGILLLGAEVFLGTQWLLWAAAAAGIVSVLCLTALPVGFVAQVAVFVILSVTMAVLTRPFLRVAGSGNDINNPHGRIVGKQAEVLSGFETGIGGERTGRVLVDGVEWPAVLEPEAGETRVVAADKVVIAAVNEGRLFVSLVP